MREYALVFAVAAVVTYLATPLARRLAIAWGAMASPRDRDVHAIPTPRLGGLAMYAGVLAAFHVASALPALSSTFRQFTDWKAVVVSGGIMCLVGAFDDRWGLDALTKLAAQGLAAGIMLLFGVQLLFIRVPGLGDGPLVLTTEMGAVITVLLAIFMINAINFIDGLDGLAAGVTAIAAGAFFWFCYQLAVVFRVERASPAALTSAILAGVCIGFLPHNFSPARVFMGDSGSMLIGLMLAASMTSGTGLIDPTGLGGRDTGFFFPVLLPLPVLAVPFVDVLLAVVRRTRAGRSVFTPDKEHLHHRLLEIGHSHRRAVLTIYFWSALFAFSGVAVSFLRPSVVLLVAAMLAAVWMLADVVLRMLASRRPPVTLAPAVVLPPLEAAVANGVALGNGNGAGPAALDAGVSPAAALDATPAPREPVPAGADPAPPAVASNPDAAVVPAPEAVVAPVAQPAPGPALAAPAPEPGPGVAPAPPAGS